MAFFMCKIIFRIIYQTMIFKKKKSKKWWWEFKRKEQWYVIKSSNTNESSGKEYQIFRVNIMIRGQEK